MGRRPFVRRIRESSGVPHNTDSDLGLPILILKNDEVDVLLSSIRMVRGNSATQLLTLYHNPRPEPRRIVDSKYSPTLADV